jgi:outer membrane protein OmpA-like peptidoglycan-associated protein
MSAFSLRMCALRALPAFLLVVGVLAAVPPAASASHEQGGSLFAGVTADGRLKGTLNYQTVGTCTVGTSTGAFPITIRRPDNATAVVDTLAGEYSRCLPRNMTMTAKIDVDLATAFPSGTPDGDYLVTFSSCCRVGGILNAATTDTTFRTQVRKVSGQTTGSPVFASEVATGVAKGFRYSQFLNATDPDGGAVAYASRAGQSDGPRNDVVELSAAGEVSIPVATTSTFLNNQFYIYKIRATDAQGDFSERDVLLRVSDRNTPPAFTGLDTTTPYAVQAGSTLQLTFGATDPNNASPKVDVVSIVAANLPAWATITTTAGNPASGTLTLAPPADLAPGTFGLNLDAFDNDATVPLGVTANLRVAITAALPAATPVITTGPGAVASSASFAFTADPATSFQCRIDDGAWAACTSPYTPAGLADGAHTFAVRALNAAGIPTSASARTWTHDTRVPAAPTILAAPADTDDTGTTFEFAGENGGSYECRLDERAWTACISPQRYTDLTRAQHTFAVRQTDGAGNTGPAREHTWTITALAAAPAEAPVARAVEAVLPPNATVSVQGSTATVGCRVDAGTLASCSVRVYALVDASLRRKGDAIIARERRIYIGRGIVRATGDASRLAVKVQLNAVGRRLLASSLGGIKVQLNLKAQTTAKTTFVSQRRGRFVPERQLVIPAGGTFRSGSPVLTRQGRTFLRTVARRLRAAKSITCAGHTDSRGRKAYNLRLGRQRAAAACTELRSLGVKTRLKVKTFGYSQPRATNATVRGRALNRRVELAVRWR